MPHASHTEYLEYQRQYRKVHDRNVMSGKRSDPHQVDNGELFALLVAWQVVGRLERLTDSGCRLVIAATCRQ